MLPTGWKRLKDKELQEGIRVSCRLIEGQKHHGTVTKVLDEKYLAARVKLDSGVILPRVPIYYMEKW